MKPKPSHLSFLVKLRTFLLVTACINSLLVLPSRVCAERNITTDIDRNMGRKQPGIPITTGFERRFATDIDDDGGDIDEWRALFGVNFGINLSKQWRLGVGVNYLYNRYNFSGSNGFSGLDPWDDIHFISLSVLVMYRHSRRLQFMVTPVVRMHAESGADFDRGLKGGGTVAAMYNFDKKLMLGLGVGASTQIEDDPSFLIFPLLRWQITDRLVVATQRKALRGGGGGLTYTISKGWKVNLGASYDSRRFRLDDDGSAPDGVGKHFGIPVWGSVTYAPSAAFKAELFGGAAVFGRVRLEDENGKRIRKEDVDPAPSLGLVIKGSF